METQKQNATVILVIALTSVIVTAIVFSALTTYPIQNVGNVKATVNLGVYSDESCKTPLAKINWSEVIPGQSYSRTIYLKNLGNVKVKLSMTTGNWTPSSASSYLNLTWNRENADLDVGASIGANLTLKVSLTAQGGPFSFDIYITATEKQ